MIRPHLRTTLGMVATLAVTIPLGALLVTGWSTTPAQHHHNLSTESTYGTMASFLPKDTITPDRTLRGTTARPALTTEGDSVIAKFASGSALISIVGPEVPGEGLPVQTAATTCTWTVTITANAGTVPVNPDDFSSIDHLGAIYHPTFVAGQIVPPPLLKPGQSATFELRATMIVGEGLMRWAPDEENIVARWDFEVEND